MPITNRNSAGTAPGVVAHFANSTAPAGWLKCNGAAVSRAAYAALFAAIGTTYGVGDGATTFNVPDLRGEFVRGLDDGRGVDAARVLGSAQAHQFASHTHALSATVYDAGGNPSTVNHTMNDGSNTQGITPISVAASGGGAETRPRNIALLACIKF